ncbi:unnamed protein product [Nippostrongylus brasiliensis]|uniref:Reverse transcriptase domain-containing protein n=1 Tax=Nippostrongylus brasiliensis TaxID=27835 RepID=A0A0N4Y4M2_NIPBR|nr:unnamed protein product [Nippostrongylus brasiliensis]
MSQTRTGKKGGGIVKPSNSARTRNSEGCNVPSIEPTAIDYSTMSVGEILNTILARNKDPEIDKMVVALVSKIPRELGDAVEAHERARSVVIYNLPEAPPEMRPSAKQVDLESKVFSILDTLDVECRPLSVYRMGAVKEGRPRLVKVVLPSTSHWRRVLANSHKLRTSSFHRVSIRRSMTREERERESVLRLECKKRNEELKKRAWVVYKGELREVQDLPNAERLGDPTNP